MHSIRCELIQPIAEETKQHVQIFPPAYSAGDTTVYLFTDATSHSVPRPHRFVYFCIMTQQLVVGSDRRKLRFSQRKAHAWHVDQSQKGFALPEIVPFELYPYHKHPVGSTYFSRF